MEEGETVPILSRKELRKQKLMEFLAAKVKLKQPNPKPCLRDDHQVKRPVTSARKVVTGKENKVPADRFSHEHSKVPIVAAQSSIHPDKRVFAVNKKVNVKGSILTNRWSAASGPALPKLNRVSSKSNLNVVSQLKKQPNTGIQTSGRAPSNAAPAGVTESNSRFSSRSYAPWSCPMRTVSVRMSLGPLVKTKTGLIPTVTQARNSQSRNLTHTIGTTTNSVGNKVQSSTLSSLSVSKRSPMAQRKTLPTTTLNNPVKRATVSSTARADIKVQDQNKSNSKPLVGKHSQPACKSQLSSGLKSTSSSSKFTAAPIKPQGRVRMPETNKSAGQPADRSTKLRSAGEGKENGQLCKVASRTSSGPVSRWSSRVVSRVTQPAVAELEGKTKTCKETDVKKGQSSSNGPLPQTIRKRTGAPGMSQTLPRPARTINFTGNTMEMKTTTTKARVKVIPQTEQKKLSAAQEERMKKLQEWREAKGISYKRPPMPVKPQVRRTVAIPQPFWATMKQEDDAHALICAVDRSLADCIKLLGEGCPPDQVKEVLSRLPAVSQKFAKYWICQARLMEQEGNLDVLPMFEEAVGVVLEPVDELRTVVFEILKKKDDLQASEEGEKTPENINNPMMTPKPVRALICGEKGDSSVVKYKITATPGGHPSQQREPARVNGQEVRFFTPVRRSVRIERASLRYPPSLQDHDLCVASYNDLISEEDKETSKEQQSGETSPSANDTPMYVYRHNEALQDKVLVQLVCSEGV
ncbi:cytoskeleton-associated protein 2-like [Chaetodon trifascialis]|uniref:cytoskeleton-associated protein 2-like n=1 Tax=Chaetodon trifascialis TaxID=109706 RepID=UPI003992F21C